MGKYTPLKEFLQGTDEDRVPMTFAQIEKVLGERLPASKSSRAWWSNNPSNNVMTKEWLDAGYRAEAVDVSAEKLVFVRRKEPDGSFVAPRHPAFGFMKGLLIPVDGYDPTEPLFPDWEEYADKKYGPGSKLYDE